MLEIVWRQAARSDLRSILEYISNDNPAAALALLEEIEAKVSALPDQPKAYRPGRVSGTREMVIRTNYLVVYMEKAEMLVILRVLHAAQMWP